MKVEGKLWPILIAFGKKHTNCLCKLHRYPVHILNQIREDLVDADNGLGAAALKILRTVTTYPGQFEGFKNHYKYKSDFPEATQGLLKAVAFVLPKIVYRHDIAIFAASQLPAPSDLGHEWWQDEYQNLKYSIRRARKAMDAYLRRGGHAAIGADNRDPELGNGTEEDSGSEEEETWEEFDPRDASEADCTICKKIRGEDIE